MGFTVSSSIKGVLSLMSEFVTCLSFLFSLKFSLFLINLDICSYAGYEWSDGSGLLETF